MKFQNTSILGDDLANDYRDKTSKSKVYIIEYGDTLQEIANRYNTTVSKLKELNDIKDSDKIYAGNRLILPSDVDRQKSYQENIEKDTKEENKNINLDFKTIIGLGSGIYLLYSYLK